MIIIIITITTMAINQNKDDDKANDSYNDIYHEHYENNHGMNSNITSISGPCETSRSIKSVQLNVHENGGSE